MPILEVEVVLQQGERVSADWARQIADHAGLVFKAAPGDVWVRVRGLPASQYAENGRGPGFDVAPIFISILRAHLSPSVTLQDETQELVSRVAQVVGRPRENVHILYLPPAAGRIAFGGKLVAS